MRIENATLTTVGARKHHAKYARREYGWDSHRATDSMAQALGRQPRRKDLAPRPRCTRVPSGIEADADSGAFPAEESCQSGGDRRSRSAYEATSRQAGIHECLRWRVTTWPFQQEWDIPNLFRRSAMNRKKSRDTDHGCFACTAARRPAVTARQSSVCRGSAAPRSPARRWSWLPGPSRRAGRRPAARWSGLRCWPRSRWRSRRAN
jgi:hypothetical protein